MPKKNPLIKKPTQSLKFTKPPSEQSGYSTETTSQDNPSIKSSLSSDNNILTQELISLTRDLNKFKGELRITQDQLKKSEKERLDFKKSLDSKESVIDKLKKEVIIYF